MNRRLSAVNQELEYLSLYDNLTGLPNRSLFRDRIGKQIEQHADAALALVIVDIDRFQEINDTLGHEAGDELLRVGRRALRQGARAGGHHQPHGGRRVRRAAGRGWCGMRR